MATGNKRPFQVLLYRYCQGLASRQSVFVCPSHSRRKVFASPRLSTASASTSQSLMAEATTNQHRNPSDLEMDVWQMNRTNRGVPPLVTGATTSPLSHLLV